MVTREGIVEVLRTIDDPEMPVSIVDLGVVEKVELQPSPAGMRVCVEILPTFVGCPALAAIESEVRRRVAALPGVAGVEVRSTFAPAWSVDRISPEGRESLRRFGVTVPRPEEAPRCPYCGSTAVRQESAFGPTRCRAIWYCVSCHHPFERLKRLAGGLVELSLRRLGGPGLPGPSR